MTNANRQLIAFSGNQNFVTIPMIYIKLTGDLNAAAVLNQIVYWSGKTKDPDGWFYKSYQEWETELGLSKYQISRVISGDKRSKKPAILASLGVTTKLKKAKGAPTVHYRIDVAVLQTAIDRYLAEHQSEIPIVNNVDNGKSTMLTMDSEQSQQSYTKNTTEDKYTTPPATPEPVGSEEQTTPKKDEPTKAPVNEVADRIKEKFAIYTTNFQIAHIIQGTYKAKKRQTDQTRVWLTLSEKFAVHPATVDDIDKFHAWYTKRVNFKIKSTDTFLNHYGEWFDISRQQAKPAPAPKPAPIDPYGIEAATRIMRKEGAA